MTIKAVVLDIGGVLEIIDDSVFPSAWERRLGLAPGTFTLATRDGLAGDPAIGEVTESELRSGWQTSLRLDDATTRELMHDYWQWYVGTLDRQLFTWFAGLRPRVKTALLSNSGPGAREHEAFWGFEAVTDDIVYSHEVGLVKPDPAIYALTESRLGVRPHEIAFLDDVPVNVEAAKAAGWHAALHIRSEESIARIEALIASRSGS